MKNDAIERRLLKEMDELTLKLEGFEKTSEEYMIISSRLYDISNTLESYETYHIVKDREERNKTGDKEFEKIVNKVFEIVDAGREFNIYENPETGEFEIKIGGKEE